jgi:hypothetical protein
MLALMTLTEAWDVDQLLRSGLALVGFALEAAVSGLCWKLFALGASFIVFRAMGAVFVAVKIDVGGAAQ